MAKKLSVEVGLEGGKELEAQLASAGKAGVVAFGDIAKAAENTGPAVARTAAEFAKLERIAAKASKEMIKGMSGVGIAAAEAAAANQKLIAGMSTAGQVTAAAAVQAAAQVQTIARGAAVATNAFSNLGKAASATLSQTGFKINNLATAFGKVESAATRMVRNLALIAGAVGLAGAGFFALIKGAADAADTLQETAAGVGIAAQSFQALANAAADSGVAPEKLAQSMGILSKAITESAAPALKEAQEQLGRFASDESIGRLASSIEATSKAAGTAKGPIAQLGISVFDAIGRLKGTDQILLEIADAFQRMPDGPQKTAIALQLFGRAGRGMIDFLNKGSAGIKEFAATMAKVGFTEEQLTMGDKFARQLLVLTTALKGIRNQIGIAFAPAVGGLIEAFTNRIIGNFSEFKARLANVMQGAIVPIINDLTRVVQGADPQTEFGAAFIQSLNAVADTARQTGEIIVAVFMGMRAAASGVASAINGVFGSNISGDALLAAAAILKFTGALGLISSSVNLAMAALRLLIGMFGLVANAARAASIAMATSWGIALAPILAPVVAFLAGFLVVWLATTDEAKQIWADLWEWVKTIPAKAFNAVLGSVNLFKQNLIDAFTKFEITTLTIPAPKVEPPDTKPTETRLGRFIAFLKDKFNAPIEELKKLFPGIFAEAKQPLNNLEGAFASVGDAGNDAGKEAAKGLQEAQRAAQQVEQQARQALKSIDDGIRGTSDSIAQLKQQQSFLAQAGGEGSQEFQANELKLKQLQRQKRAQLEARREQERANMEARQNAQQDIQRALEKQSVERQAFQQRLRELDEIEKRQRAGGGPTPSPFLPLAPQPAGAPAGAEQEKAQGLDALKGKADAAKESISQLGQAMAGLQTIFDQAVQGINAAFGSIDLVEKFNPIVEAARAAVEQIKQVFTFDLGQSITLDWGNIISNAFTAAQSVSSAFQNVDISSALSAQIDALISKFNELANAAARAASAASNIGGGGGGGVEPEGEFARGGLLGGRGTGTSDSNLAWVSRGEHIMPARAVAQPGVLAFLEALRRSGGNLRRVLDDMGRFALGGMVPRAMPAFASGGLNGGTSNVTIQFPGLPPISGLRASSDVVDQLHKAAALAQVRSGGRKPSRYS